MFLSVKKSQQHKGVVSDTISSWSSLSLTRGGWSWAATHCRDNFWRSSQGSPWSHLCLKQCPRPLGGELCYWRSLSTTIHSVFPVSSSFVQYLILPKTGSWVTWWGVRKRRNFILCFALGKWKLRYACHSEWFNTDHFFFVLTLNFLKSNLCIYTYRVCISMYYMCNINIHKSKWRKIGVDIFN